MCLTKSHTTLGSNTTSESLRHLWWCLVMQTVPTGVQPSPQVNVKERRGPKAYQVNGKVLEREISFSDFSP